MHLSKSQINEVKQIVSEMSCPKDFICYSSDFENLCKVKDVDLDCLVCLGSANDRVCGFTVSCECDYLCNCPLRKYIARTLGR